MRPLEGRGPSGACWKALERVHRRETRMTGTMRNVAVGIPPPSPEATYVALPSPRIHGPNRTALDSGHPRHQLSMTCKPPAFRLVTSIELQGDEGSKLAPWDQAQHNLPRRKTRKTRGCGKQLSECH